MTKPKHPRPFFILIDGPMGSGKTTVATLLHGKLKRTAHLGLDRIKWFISDFKRVPADNEIVREVIMAMTKTYLRNGINVVVEQGMRKHRVAAIKKFAKEHRIRFFSYRLDAPKALLFKRIMQRPAPQHHPKVSKARIERNYRAHLEHSYSGATVLDSERFTAPKIASLILKDVKARR